MFSPENSARDMMHERVHYCDEAANHQLPIAADFCIIQIVSKEECSSLMQNPVQIPCPTCSVILNTTATQHKYSLNGIYHSHLLSTVKLSFLICSQMLYHWAIPPPPKLSFFIHVHSSPLPLSARLHPHCANCSCYLTMAGLFPDRPHILNLGGLDCVSKMNSAMLCL